MKVLFAVSSESISDAIIKRYQKEYKEILSYKNVYYFNAILKEIQKDKSYDRIVISEDLEPFSNNNYDTIDKFIFEKLDNISDEAHDSQGKETSIILICTDRHTKGSSFLVKLFGIGVYNALLGSDRSMDQVCKLINQPRVKKEAKMYYKIDSEDVSYDPKSEKEVSELEIQNILNHFKKIAKNKDKYSDSFNNIASQYTDDQLKIIINCLPVSVKAVLEEECPKYQELVSVNGMIQRVGAKATSATKDAEAKTGIKIDILENKMQQQKMSGPIVIPSSIKTAGNKGKIKVKQVENNIRTVEPQKKVVKKIEHNQPVKKDDENDDLDLILSDLDDFEDENLVSKNNNEKKQEIKNEKSDKSALLDALKDESNNEDSLMSLNDDEEFDDSDLDLNLDDEIDDDDLSLDVDNTLEDTDELLPSFDDEDKQEEEKQTTIKKGRGRPRKNPIDTTPKPKGKRGRPRKVDATQVDDEDSLSLVLDDEELSPASFSDDLELNLSDEETQDEDLDLNLTDDVDFDDDDDLNISLDYDDEEDEDNLDLNLSDEETQDEDLDLNLTDDVDFDDDDDLNVNLDEYDDNDFDMSSLGDDEVVLSDGSNNNLDDEYTDEVDLPEVDDLDDYDEDNDILPGIEYDDMEDDDYTLDNNKEDDDDDLLLNINDNILDNSSDEEDDEPILNQSYTNQNNRTNSIDTVKPQVDYSMSTLNSLLTKDKKIVTFLGTTKNGTSFLINNLAALFASLGINTAVLDMTKNRNSYYIYTKNEEELRKVAYTAIEKLQNGFAEGIKVDRNLTVYTALPNDGKDYSNAEPILSTLVQNHSLILIDCDFDTDPSYFASCQEIYLVQSMDILTIQPLTSFLRDLKAKGVLESEKVRVVINKEIKVRSLSTKVIIGGMSFYNDPAMSFMTELFNKDMVKACSIPFEDAAYSKYLDAMVNCNVSLNGYSKAFLSKLRILGDMVYPLTSKQTYSKPVQNNYNKNNNFSNSMNNTLNRMKNKF